MTDAFTQAYLQHGIEVAQVAADSRAAQHAPASLAAALAAFQAELPDVTKTKTAKVKGQTKDGRMFEYEYKYADLADVSKAVMPLMGKHGLAFTCQPGERDDGRLGVAYQLLHSSGEHIDGWFPVKADLKMQDIGGSITYIRRYALCSLIGVAAEEDTDAQGIDAAKPDRKPRASPPQRAAGNLPRNTDGSTSRSRTTDAELADTGQMTDAQIRDHGRLERDVKGTGPQGTERLAATPQDDPWLLPEHNHPAGPDDPTPLYGECPGCLAGAPRDRPQASVRTPVAAGNPRGVIFQHFTRLEYGDSPEDRTARLKVLATICGRAITSTNDLTAAEGVKVIGVLQKAKDHASLAEKLAVMAGEDIP